VSTQPENIGPYRILREIGRGAMGEVYLARDTRLGREVALKLLPEAYAQDPDRLERFQREARIASALNHPHICTIHDIGEDGGRYFIVMEWIEGQTLRAVSTTRLPLATLRSVGGQIARALAAAHAAGIVHRDIKPGNVMVRDDGYVKVLDFGLARAVGSAQRDDAHADLTEAGTLLGTVRYMSPEQARGNTVGCESDVFSLGVVLYELATGQHPFQADSRAGVLTALLSHTPPPPSRLDPEIPAGFSALIQQMLAYEAPLRPTAEAVVRALATPTDRGSEHTLRGTAAAPARHSVGRRAEREALDHALETAAAGQGLFLCVTGEPGIGKTTLVEDFLADLGTLDRGCIVGRGRCSERLAGAEAYLPFLEALESLLRGTAGESVARTMKTVAPNWYVQVAPLAAEDSSLSRALDEVKAISQVRIKRELGAFLQEVSRVQPLVLFFDDLHWADASTVDLLAYLGGRCEGLRVLLVVSYRPTDLTLAEHPFGALKLDLQARSLCREVALGFLSRDDVERYLALEFPGHRFAPELADLVHARTEGSPLFMADLLRYLRDGKVMTQEDGRWTLGRSIRDLEDTLPESVRSMIQRKIDQLEDGDRRLLVAASVQGNEFDAVVVAEALGRDAAEVEDRLEVLDRVHTFVVVVGEQELPDWTLTLRYRFVHVLYQNALFAMLRPARRAALCAAVARSLQAHQAEELGQAAAELAMLFEGARDFEQAADYFLRAARHAARLFANREAVALARRGLRLLETLPDTPERARKELALLVTMGMPLKDTAGWTAPEVEAVYTRANALCERIGPTPDLFPTLWGLWMYHSSVSPVSECRRRGEQLLALAEGADDHALRLQAHHTLWTVESIAGNWREALDHADQGSAIYDPAAHHEQTFLYGGHDPGMCCRQFAAMSLWMLGYPDQALRRAQESVSLARELSHPMSVALALQTLACVHQFRGEELETRTEAERCQRLVVEHAIPLWPSALVGWARARQGDVQGGLAELRAAVSECAVGPAFLRCYFHALLAEILLEGGRLDEARSEIAAMRAISAAIETGFYAAEHHRLEGEALRAMGPGHADEAEAAMREALVVARGQGAKSLELRSVMSLVRLLGAGDRGGEIRTLLAEHSAWFTEGLDTEDLRDARALMGAGS